MKLFLLTMLMLLISCDNPISSKDSEETYTREFSNRDIASLKQHSQNWLFNNLNQVDFQAFSDTSVIGGNAEDYNFDGDGSKLFFKFFMEFEDNRYILSLKADYKEVKSYNSETGQDYTETESVQVSDKDDLEDLFDKIDKELYNYILFSSSGAGSL